MSQIPTNLLARFLREEDGATAVEYGLILALMALAVVGAVGTLGGRIGGNFDMILTRFTEEVDVPDVE